MTNKIGTKVLPTNTTGTSMSIMELFKNNPDTYYTQAELAGYVQKSGPRVNKTLRTLCEQGVVGRTKVGLKYFYKLK